MLYVRVKKKICFEGGKKIVSSYLFIAKQTPRVINVSICFILGCMQNTFRPSSVLVYFMFGMRNENVIGNRMW